MAKSQNRSIKNEKEKRKAQKRQDKEQRKEERKGQAKDGKSLDDMMAYVDENGNISDTPPDPSRKQEIKLEDIEIGVPQYTPPTQAELTRTGKVTFFNNEKGFGFIKDHASQESVFVHANNLSDSLKENDKVTFEIEMGQRGAYAVNVKKTV